MLIDLISTGIGCVCFVGSNLGGYNGEVSYSVSTGVTTFNYGLVIVVGYSTYSRGY